MIDDVLGLIVLALVSGMAKGPINYLDVGLTAALAVRLHGLHGRSWERGRRAGLCRACSARLVHAEGEFSIALSVLFALSLVAVYAGVAAIVGAFLAGMALSETAEKRVLHLTSGVTELLVPFFLVGIGLHFDLSALSPSPPRSGWRS